MTSLLNISLYFGAVLSLVAYGIGVALKKRLKHPICNPLLIAIFLTIGVLVVLDIDYETYNGSAKYISYLLTPATICLGIPLYEQISLLKDNWKAIVLGIASGVITSLATIYVFALVFGLSNAEYVTFLPKSITTAIGIGVSEELGGYPAITAAVIIITGVLGNIMAESILKIFRINNPIARGIAIGTSSHAIGTARAMEIGEVEGAMSSLSIVVAGIITVILASVFAGFM